MSKGNNLTIFIKDPNTGGINKVSLNNLKSKTVKKPQKDEQYKSPNNHWSKKKITELLKEVIEPSTVDVTSIQINDKLSLDIWESADKMIPEIRKKLLMNAKRFIEFSDIENLKFNDITLTGSLANYNYNDNSDLDVHIIMDFNQISENDEFVEDYFKMKKQLWANDYPIQIKTHEVELYLQNSKEPHYSSGVYSLINDNWVTKPIKKIINIDINTIQAKSAEIMNLIDNLEKERDDVKFLNRHEILKNKLKKYRQTGLDTKGEYSNENLVFKILRNNGYLEKLTNMKNDFITSELSLDEILNPNL